MGGFDNRGCSASLHSASQTGLTVSGYFSDLADFVTLYLFDSDDRFGHLYTSKYLPNFNLSGVVVEFDLAIVNCFSPVSSKYPSVHQNALQWIKQDGSTSGTTPPALVVTSQTGGAAASCTYTVNTASSPAIYDRVQLFYLGNVVFDYLCTGSETTTQIATNLAAQVNTYGAPLSATSSGNQFTITYTLVNSDGNSVELLELHKNSNTYLTPAGTSKLIGGIDPTSCHVKIDFTALGIEDLRQCWLTIAPPQPYDSGSVNPAQVAFSPLEFSYTISNISITDPGSNCPLSIAGPGSVVVDSNDTWSSFDGTWVTQAGDFSRGFSKGSSSIGDTVTITYSCQYTHDLYLGTILYTDLGKFEVTIDGTAISDFDCYLPNLSEQLVCRRLLSSGLISGNHTVVLEVATKNSSSTGNTVYFDYLHAVIPGNPVSPTVTYPNVTAAMDWDTDQTYKIPAARNLFYLQQVGFLGDIDLYAGVFFALKRRRRGGFFHSATLTVAWSGSFNTGTGFGDGDAFFVTISSDSLGVAAYPADTPTTIAQRFVNAINASFVGIWTTSAAGVVTITSITPINGFTISVSSSTTSATWTLSGDILAGNEGIWEIDPTQTLPINRAFVDYLNDFCAVCLANSFTFTLAFSQELLAPPDANTSGGAWIQRFANGQTVLTATEFGSWGSGYVEAVSGSGPYTIQQTGHGYISGYLSSIGGGDPVTVIDTNHYSVANSVTVGQLVNVQLQTSQCNFNPSTFTAYSILYYVQAANIMNAAGITEPWVQFGEIGWWFFADSEPSMAYYDAYTSAAATSALSRSLYSFTDPNNDPSVNSYADANFLVSQLQAHIHSIRVAVLAAQSSCKFSWLWPSDVNWFTAYENGTYPFLTGGQLNRYVNTPSDYQSPGSDIDRVDQEALAWGTTYYTLDNAIVSMSIPFTSPWTWTPSEMKYLVPWDNGGCPWPDETFQAQTRNISQIVMWALDHLTLFSWQLPFPTQLSGVQ
jgi:hypothetical protein